MERSQIARRTDIELVEKSIFFYFIQKISEDYTRILAFGTFMSFLSWTSSNLCLLIFSQGAARKLATQRKNIEVVESVGVAGKSDPDRKVKYFTLEVSVFFPFSHNIVSSCFPR